MIGNIWQNLGEDADGDGHTIEYINGRIDYYNRLCDDEFAKNGAIYDYIDPISKWGVKVKLSQSMLTNINDNSYSNPKETIHIINNEYIYKCALKLDSEQFVERFNKMIYVYLIKISDQNNLKY